MPNTITLQAPIRFLVMYYFFSVRSTKDSFLFKKKNLKIVVVGPVEIVEKLANA